MKVLVVGGGGREHTIVWKISQSPKVDKIYCAPGNAGIEDFAECVDIGAKDIDDIVANFNKNEYNKSCFSNKGRFIWRIYILKG